VAAAGSPALVVRPTLVVISRHDCIESKRVTRGSSPWMKGGGMAAELTGQGRNLQRWHGVHRGEVWSADKRIWQWR
jgi:hypothetical protein